MCEKSVLDPIPRTQHRPICVTINPVIVTQPTTSRRRFSQKKANWDGFSNQFDAATEEINSIPNNYRRFIELLYVWCPEDTFQEDVDQTTYQVSPSSPRVSMKHTKDSIRETLLAKVQWRLEQS